ALPISLRRGRGRHQLRGDRLHRPRPHRQPRPTRTPLTIPPTVTTPPSATAGPTRGPPCQPSHHAGTPDSTARVFSGVRRASWSRSLNRSQGWVATSLLARGSRATIRPAPPI